MEHSENEHPLPGRIMLATVRHQHDWRVLLPWGIVVLILLALPPGLQAQAPGVVTGRVSDALTNESLPGATVRIDSTSIGVASDLDGDFRIQRVPSGAQVLVVSFIGYKTQRIPISVPSGEVLHLDVQLSFDTIEGEEIVVLAQAEGQIKAINQQLASNTIVNVVSAARIRELPDVNAAESVGRLPGVSIIRNAGEGQKVVIRGLSPEYNNVLVNGQRIPGTDSNDRSTDLSMISSDMLAGIEVVKALTPDRDADMIGGTIDFRLRDAPDGFRSDVRLQTGYSGQQEELGFYKGNLQLSQRFFGNRLGVLGQVNVERADRSSDVFSAGYNRDRVTLEEGETPRLEIGSLNLSDRAEIRHRYGGSLILDYRLPNGRIQFSNFFSRLNRDEVRFNKNYSLGGRTVTYGIRDREIISDVLSNTLQGNLTVAGSELDFAASHAVAHQDRPYDNEFEFLELAAFTPDLIVDQGPEVIPQSAKNILDETHLRVGDHYGINNQERDLSASFNLRTPFVLGRKISGYTKFGAKYRTKKRSNEETRSYLPYYFGEGANYVRAAFPDTDLEATSQGFIPLTSFLNPDHDVSNFLDGQYDLSVALDRDLVSEAYEGVSDRYFISKFAAMNDFEMKETITAGYAMLELNLGSRLMILPGIRYEHTNTHYDAKSGVSQGARSNQGDFVDTTATRSFGQWFPMLHVRYRFTDWLDLRLARTRSLSRAGYRDYSPRQRIQTGGNLSVDRGNPELRPISALNYDAFLSVYTNRLGLLAVGVFYKELEDVIYGLARTILDPEADGLPPYTRGARLTQPINNEYLTTVKGVEFEWQTHFTYLPGLLSGLVLNVNYTRISSDTRYPQVRLIRDTVPPFRQTEIDTFRVGRMLNQPEHVGNVSVGYDRGGFSGRISVIYTRSSLTRIRDFPEEDGFTDTYVRWDAALRQKVGRRMNVFFNLNNFTDRPDVSSIGIGFPTTEEHYGWTADFGVRYRF